MRSNLLRLIFVFLMAAAAPAAWAATIPVTTTVDEADGSCGDGDCSLRDAVATAASGDTVQIPAGHYVLTLGEISTNKVLILAGAGARTTVIDGNASSRLFLIITPANVELTDLSLVNGREGFGGAIQVVSTGANVALTVRRSTFTGNQSTSDGGAIFVEGLTRFTLEGSTFSDNHADRGGAIYGESLFVLTGANNTFSGNSARTGGALSGSFDQLLLTNVTIAGNQASGSAGGIGVEVFEQVSLVNTIVAGNTGGDCAITGTTSSTNSLDSDNTCGLTGPGDLPGVNPLLGPLANNGGPTDTRALLAGSPAIDAGDDGACPPTDQRGIARPQGPACDIGAYEAEIVENAPPNCSGAAPSVARIWPPNHKMVPVSIQGVTDPDGDPVSIQISQVRQDEPTNGSGDGNTCPDAQGLGGATASVRAERSGQGNGRVYTLSFTATDDQGATCQGSVKVCVPHSSQGTCVDNGPQFDSTVCSGGSALSASSSGHSHKSVSSGLNLLCGSHFPTLECDLGCDASILICQ